MDLFAEVEARTKAALASLQSEGVLPADVALPEVAPDYAVADAGKTFGQWLQIGFALSLPLIAFGCIALLLFLWLTAKSQ